MKRSSVINVKSAQRRTAMMFFIAESMRRGVLLYNEAYSTAAYESPGADAEFQSHGIMTESPVAVDSPANLECIVVFDHKSGAVQGVSLHEWKGPRPTALISIWSDPETTNITLLYSGDEMSMCDVGKASLMAAAMFGHESMAEAGVALTRAWRLSLTVKEEDAMMALLSLESENNPEMGKFQEFVQAATEPFALEWD